IGKPPKGAKAVARKVSSELKTTRIGRDAVISPHAVIYTDVTIGEGTLIGDGASIREECRIGKNCLLSRYVTVNYNTTIGDYTKIMDLTHMTGNMKIGSHVFIAPLVASANDNNLGRKGYDEMFIKGPEIEDYVGIGVGAILLPYIKIGRGSIVGAGAVVTKDVPPNKVVMGVPARIVKELEEIEYENPDE
ncbi:MAG: transferase, partial [Thermoplasmata archaeon]